MRAKTRRRCARIGVWFAGALLAASAADATTSFNLELRELTGENPAARNVYICEQCTLEQFLAVPLPAPNWEKNASEGNARLFLPDEGTNTPPIPPPGTALALDLVPEIAGDDHFLIAQVLNATVLGFGAQGVMASAEVARGTTMTFYAGRVIHTLTTGGAIEYLLFSMSEAATTTFDPFEVNGLAGMSVPTGWTYSSEVLAEDLVVVTPGGIANVFTAADYWTWQEVVVPEPGRFGMFAVGSAVLVLMAQRRRREPSRTR